MTSDLSGDKNSTRPLVIMSKISKGRVTLSKEEIYYLGNDHNKPHSLMSDPVSTMYFHKMSLDLSNKILFKPTLSKALVL